MSRIFVQGGANIDITASVDQKIVYQDSNMGKISLSYGGVARNIAENLSWLGEHPVFITCFSDDYFGKLLQENCLSLGFDLTYSRVIEGASSSVYLALLDENRELAAGVSDMTIMKQVTREDIDRFSKAIEEDDYLFVDTNLASDLLEYTVKKCKGKKIADAISVNKVNHLFSSIPYLDILKLNRLEAEAVCGMKLEDDVHIISFLKVLSEKGCKEVLVTVKDGVYIGEKGRVYRYVHDAADKDVVNVTGAGDAFLAAYVYARSRKAGIESAAIMGLASALITVRSARAVAKVTKNDIKKELMNVRISGGAIYP